VFEPFSYTHKENNRFVCALAVKAARFGVLQSFLESHKKYFHNTPRTSIIIEPDIETLG
jgi:hypothetical protein